MSASRIIESATDDEIQAAQAVALLRLKNAHEYTLADIARVMGGCKQSVSQYISNGTEMGSAAWIKLENEWPQLREMMLAELDVAEKSAAAKQRVFKI